MPDLFDIFVKLNENIQKYLIWIVTTLVTTVKQSYQIHFTVQVYLTLPENTFSRHKNYATRHTEIFDKSAGSKMADSMHTSTRSAIKSYFSVNDSAGSSQNRKKDGKRKE